MKSVKLTQTKKPKTTSGKKQNKVSDSLEKKIPFLKIGFVLPAQDSKDCYLIQEEAGEFVFRVDGYGGEFCRRVDGILSVNEIIRDMIIEFSLPKKEFTKYIFELLEDLKKHDVVSFATDLR